MTIWKARRSYQQIGRDYQSSDMAISEDKILELGQKAYRLVEHLSPREAMLVLGGTMALVLYSGDYVPEDRQSAFDGFCVGVQTLLTKEEEPEC